MSGLKLISAKKMNLLQIKTEFQKIKVKVITIF